ncbi:acyl-CoA dehydrogenase family protein [Streptomyces sp. NPDC002490]|uniref:acyl-CoA dehydrogenase family protein n=1 Tax=Streptomyces sp. NPDC002490 TaxID=3154416 RepID=UPI00331C0561
MTHGLALDTPTAAVLQEALLGRDDRRARTVVAETTVPGGTERSYQERARAGYEQLRQVVARLGPSSRVAEDLPLLFDLFDWSLVASPDLFSVLSGHFTLTVGAIQSLGTDTAEQRETLALLDDAGYAGVFLLTELGYGSNVLELRTEARWDSARRRFTLHTPEPAAVKFMPNVADDQVPKVTVIAARLIADGRDEGVFPFLLTLRGPDGLAPGVEVQRMPDKGYCPMDNALIRFDGAVVPEGGWLSGGIADFDEHGRFRSEVATLRERFHRTVAQLQTGRVALSSAAVAAARAGLWLTVHYARQRRTAGGTPMIARDNVHRPLVLATARVCAATALSRVARETFTDPERRRSEGPVLAMLAKPLLSDIALETLQECRERLGAQGMFRANMITEYLGSTQGVVTAEGDNQVLQVAAGRALGHARRTPLPAPAPGAPRWQGVLDRHARALVERSDPDSGWEALRTAQANAVAWAAHALLDTARRTEHPGARGLLEDLAELYALDTVLDHAAEYLHHKALESTELPALEERREELATALAPRLPLITRAFGVSADALPTAFIAGDYQDTWIRSTGWTWPIGDHAPAAG